MKSIFGLLSWFLSGKGNNVAVRLQDKFSSLNILFFTIEKQSFEVNGYIHFKYIYLFYFGKKGPCQDFNSYSSDSLM